MFFSSTDAASSALNKLKQSHENVLVSKGKDPFKAGSLVKGTSSYLRGLITKQQLLSIIYGQEQDFHNKDGKSVCTFITDSMN